MYVRMAIRAFHRLLSKWPLPKSHHQRPSKSQMVKLDEISMNITGYISMNISMNISIN